MTRQLVVLKGPDQGRIFPLPQEGVLLIGRSQAVDFRLNDPRMSRAHCQIHVKPNLVSVTDNESAGGTFLNGRRITQQELRPGDTLQLGETQLRFVGEPDEPSTLMTAGHAAAGAAPVPADPAKLAGTMLLHYQAGPVLAQGQSGVVLRARDTRNGREVALKVLRPELCADEQTVQRFLRAMEAVAPLYHPNLVTVYEAGRSGPHCWAAMEFVEGESLTEVIRRIGIAGMLDWRHAFRVAVHIGRALEYAHALGVIHRNILPPNILIRAADKLAKLGDLMLSKALEGGPAQITRPGELVGEVRYMAPERTHGSGELDARSDIYSLGATVYALLTGRPPFEGHSLAETLTQIRQGELVRPTKYQLSIPGLFEGVVLKMLARRPDERYQSARELLAELERVGKYQRCTV